MPRYVRLSPPRPSTDLEKWRLELFERLGEGAFKVQGYSVAALPAANQWGSIAPADSFSSLIFVFDESGVPTIAYSDGTDWRRIYDNAIVT